MVSNSVHMEKLMDILAEFSERNPQVNLAAPDTQRELAIKIAKDWGSWRGNIRKRTESLIDSYEAELEKALEKFKDEGDEVHVTR